MLRSIVIGFIAGALLLASLFLLSYLGVGTTSQGEINELVYDGAKPNDAQASQLLQQLIERIYLAFNADKEEAVYDHLAVAVDHAILPELYLQQRRAQWVSDETGARVDVNKVEFERTEVRSREKNGQRLTLDTRWSAFGMVGHSGHEHRRVNRYHALITIEPISGAWRISGFELLDEKRLVTNNDAADHNQ